MDFPHKIFCIGIGGIGLSALAQLLKHEGHDVSGSDRSESPVTELLRTKGIQVLTPQSQENISEDIDLVIYSAAVHEDNPERVRVKELGLKEMNYFEALGEVSKKKHTVAVSGTHGKTTTTAMITKMLVDLGKSPTAIIGSLTKDFESNFIAGESDVLVVEACEYRRHFLHLTPSVLVITNIELDHTDYFKDLDDLIAAFHEMSTKVLEGGAIVANTASPAILKALVGVSAPILNYLTEDSPELELLGDFNKANARAAKAAVKALYPDADEEVLDRSLTAFKGTWRRFEFKGKTETGALVYDDYAHHPTAIRETLRAVREQFKSMRIIVAFHPHLYSRTKSLMDEFAASFNEADMTLIAPIFAAREAPDPEVSSEILASRAREAGSHVEALGSLEAIEERLRAEAGEGDVVITMGAGDIYKVADALVS